ncbi:hypothetical protein [Streptomyces sp. URMC 129]|uniref:hypothetical protein n=1 Tax=Streptomyces sp. URMC 129 TaxID=3423407 RepID=UPI003F1D1681
MPQFIVRSGHSERPENPPQPPPAQEQPDSLEELRRRAALLGEEIDAHLGGLKK